MTVQYIAWSTFSYSNEGGGKFNNGLMCKCSPIHSCIEKMNHEREEKRRKKRGKNELQGLVLQAQSLAWLRKNILAGSMIKYLVVVMACKYFLINSILHHTE